LLKSGSITRGHGATGAHFDPEEPEDPGHPQLLFGFPHELQLDFLHPHISEGAPHLLQGRAFEKPSYPDESAPPTRTRRPSELVLYIKPATPKEASIIATIPINAM
jgi:hypothetical protein